MSKIILLHEIRSSIGGTKTVLNDIQNSYLKEKFQFERLIQDEGCGFNPFKAIWFINQYRKKINKHNADIIYVCGLQYSAFLITIAAKLSNVKRILICVHGSEWDNPNRSFRKKVLMYIIEPITVWLADSVFTCCKAALHTNRALSLGKHGNNVFGAIYNRCPQINCDDFIRGKVRSELHISNNKIVVSVVGRVWEAKGHAYIIQAIKQIEDDNFVFVIVGTGGYLDVYQRELQSRIENKSLFLLGNRDDVYQILKDSDIFLFASLNENHSMALMEAACMKCACICTNVGGNTEIIQDGYSGCVIEPRNCQQIRDSLNKLTDVKLRREYGENACNYVKKTFSESKTYGELERLFDSL